jgi:hypothetical protein
MELLTPKCTRQVNAEVIFFVALSTRGYYFTLLGNLRFAHIRLGDFAVVTWVIFGCPPSPHG